MYFVERRDTDEKNDVVIFHMSVLLIGMALFMASRLGGDLVGTERREHV